MRSIVFALALALVLALAPAARAQNPFAQPEPARNVGAIGIGVDAAAGKLTVKSVIAGGPAEKAGVRAGDVVAGVDGKAFDASGDAVLEVVAAIERAEASKKDATLILIIERDGKATPVKLAIAPLGKHSPTCPKKCDKCKKIAAAGVEWLARAQDSSGCFPTELGGKTGKVVVTSLGGLALLAAGAPLDGAIDRATGYVLGHCGAKDDSPLGGMGGGGGGNWNQTNWELAYGSIFLAEVAHRTKRADVREKLATVSQLLAKNQEQSGGWAHGPGGPNALGYLELEIMSNWSLMGIGCARREGVAFDAKLIERALEWIENTSSGDGGVGYSERAGQKGFGEAGRTSGAIVAYSLLAERRRPFFEKMAGFYRGHMRTLETGHVSPCMHLATGALASRQLGARDWQEFMDQYRLAIMAARKPDGSFAPTPTHESQALHSNTDAQVGACWTTATYVLILSLANDRLGALEGKSAPEKPEKEKPGRTATGSGG